MAVVIDQFEVVEPPATLGEPQGAAGPSPSEVEHEVERQLRRYRERAMRLRAY